jgi:hypothetical protein
VIVFGNLNYLQINATELRFLYKIARGLNSKLICQQHVNSLATILKTNCQA